MNIRPVVISFIRTCGNRKNALFIISSFADIWNTVSSNQTHDIVFFSVSSVNVIGIVESAFLAYTEKACKW